MGFQGRPDHVKLMRGKGGRKLWCEIEPTGRQDEHQVFHHWPCGDLTLAGSRSENGTASSFIVA